jgi:hypothetical protein
MPIQFEPDTTPSPFAACQSIDEVVLVLARLLGPGAVDEVLAGAGLFKEQLREAAGRLDRVGLKPLAQALRRHARRAKPAPATTFKKRWQHKAAPVI